MEYRKVFHILWRIKRAEWRLASAWRLHTSATHVRVSERANSTRWKPNRWRVHAGVYEKQRGEEGERGGTDLSTSSAMLERGACDGIEKRGLLDVYHGRARRHIRKRRPRQRKVQVPSNVDPDAFYCENLTTLVEWRHGCLLLRLHPDIKTNTSVA